MSPPTFSDEEAAAIIVAATKADAKALFDSGCAEVASVLQDHANRIGREIPAALAKQRERDAKIARADHDCRCRPGNDCCADWAGVQIAAAIKGQA